MLFGKRNRRPTPPSARRVINGAESAMGSVSTSNGPDTPVMNVSAMKRALEHAAWRDPSFENRKNEELRTAIRILERTAACVDLAQERLNEAAETLMLGQASPEQVIRGLLTARFEELLDSLQRVAILAQDGHINLLGGISGSPLGQTTQYRVGSQENGLSLDIGTAGFSYVLMPIDISRGPAGLSIPVLENGFDAAGETYQVETAVLKAQKRLAQFGERLSNDAIMLVKIAQAQEAAHRAAAEVSATLAHESTDLQTKTEDVA